MRTAFYVRVSTSRQAQAQTIEQQLDRRRTHMQEQGEDIVSETIFRDDGYSGNHNAPLRKRLFMGSDPSRRTGVTVSAFDGCICCWLRIISPESRSPADNRSKRIVMAGLCRNPVSQPSG
ncbi:hypothetical protein FZ983_11335 [Azospirillum sp. B21]|uniref:recombinase family protein n=1 Tax=Azospirillum sp. B21 TaxID=2607496 RepID=UPI0011EC242E|nr:recombinase family protein [Azospirillum sp. B21]KAA0580186.1 hypothetical protein FZ983_11335 [Azospirillum sp. B21]